METTALKSSIHKIIDRIENEQLLNTLYDFLKTRKKNHFGDLWKSLTEDQKAEVLLAFKESEDEENLIDVNKLFQFAQ